MYLARQLDLSLNSEVTLPFAPDEPYEKNIGGNHRDDRPESEHRILFLKNISVLNDL